MNATETSHRGDAEAQREQFRQEQSKHTKEWLEQRVWDLCDDIGKGYNQLDKLSDAEVVQYARGKSDVLEAIGERFECDSLQIRTKVDGALGERYHRANSPAGNFKRRLFGNLAMEIRAKRVAMLDAYESLDYAQYSGWRKRVWSIERKGYTLEEAAEFTQLQHELNAIWSLSSWLLNSNYWRQKNWEARKPKPEVLPQAA